MTGCLSAKGPRVGLGLDQQPPHRQLHHVRAAVCAMIGGDEVVADNSEKASRQRASTSSASGQNARTASACIPCAGCRRGAGARRPPCRGGPSRGPPGRSQQLAAVRRARTAGAAWPGRRRPRLDALDDLVDAPAPRVEHLLEQRAAVVEVPVEAALGDAERLAPAPRSGPRPDRRRPAPAGPPRSSCCGRAGGAAIASASPVAES